MTDETAAAARDDRQASGHPGSAAPAAPAGPPPAFWSVAIASNQEYVRRMRQATLVPVVAAMAGVFVLSMSILPEGWLSNLLLSYLAFLGLLAVALALALLRVTGGDYGRAMSVAEAGRQGTLRAREAATGDARLPESPAQAAAWLAAYEGREGVDPQRLAVQILAGDLAGARQSLGRYARSTPFERYWYEADAWTLDMLEGRVRDLSALEAEVQATSDPAQRAHAEAGLALLRSYVELLAGRDWIHPLADAYDRMGPFVDHRWRAPVIVRTWTLNMAIAALFIGGAMVVGRLTGVWPPPF